MDNEKKLGLAIAAILADHIIIPTVKPKRHNYYNYNIDNMFNRTKNRYNLLITISDVCVYINLHNHNYICIQIGIYNIFIDNTPSNSNIYIQTIRTTSCPNQNYSSSLNGLNSLQYDLYRQLL